MNLSKRRAKIVATLGPASYDSAMMRAFLESGLDVARFNFSHGGPEQLAPEIEKFRRIGKELGREAAVLQDLCGPKIRTCLIGGDKKGTIELVNGALFTLTTREVYGDQNEVSVTYQDLAHDCNPGDKILLDDGTITLLVEKTTDTDVLCTVVDGGILKSNKGINLPGVKVSAPALSPKDLSDVAWGIENGVDYVALSFVRTPQDVLDLRQIIDARNGHCKIIAKLEKPEAIEQLEAIIEAADGVMVARGDLGVEMPAEEVPLLQKQIINAANKAGKLVITATQMLESMTVNSRPTRAEANDVANAVLDGSDALMLSGETAAGEHPLASLQMMSRIIERVEKSADDLWKNYRQTRRHEKEELGDFTAAICEAAAHAAAGLKAKAIACFTETGDTAREVAKYRPPVPIVAFTPDEDVARGLNLAWGVQPYLIGRHNTTDEMIVQADEAFTSSGEVHNGDRIVMTMGAPVALRGSTNLLKLHRIGEVHAMNDISPKNVQ